MNLGTDRLTAAGRGAIGWITINNPDRHNAMSLAMWQALGRAVDAFAADETIRVVIVRGAGDRAFASGADISEFAEKRATLAQVEAYDGAAEESCRKLELLGKPTLAMIHGYCIGGGLDLALRCDLRIASETAKFGVPAARLGLGYPFSDVQRLMQVVGPAFAKEIFYLGRQFTASEAANMGLVNQVVAPGELESAVVSQAMVISENAPLTIAAVKRCVAEALKDPAERDLAGCSAAVQACFASGDYVEGRTAFMQKRKAVFSGR